MSGNNVWKPFKRFEYQNLLPAELRSKVRSSPCVYMRPEASGRETN